MSENLIHPQALCQPGSIGQGTTVAAFVTVDPSARIGVDCVVQAGVRIGAGVEIGDRVKIGENAVLSGGSVGDAPPTRILDGAQIGSNATVLPGLTIGAEAIIAPGSLVSHTVPTYAEVAGNPALIQGYVDSPMLTEVIEPGDQPHAGSKQPRDTSVRGVQIHYLNSVGDLRGMLAASEFTKEMPFTPQRCFMVYDVPSAKVRGEHAHRACHQLLLCVHGSCTVMADDGENRQTFELSGPARGLYLPPMTWASQYNYSGDGVLLVFASHPYDSDDYIRDYPVFLQELRTSN